MNTDAWLFGLDPRTLLFSLAVTALVNAVFAFRLARTLTRNDHGLGSWSASMGATALSLLVFSMKGHVPRLWVVFGANLVVLAAAGFAVRAYRRFFHLPPWRWTLAGLIALGMSGPLLVYFLGQSGVLASITMSLALFLLLGSSLLVLHRMRATHNSVATRLAKVTLLALCSVYAWRVLIGLFGDGSSLKLTSSSHPHLLLMLSSVLYVNVASMAFMLMVHEREHDAALDSLRRDALTGLHIRSVFFEQLAELHSQANTGYALIMLDIDHFKRINDVHGHARGDVVLSHVGRLLMRSVRGMDLVGRYGGEEFCIALPACGWSDAQQFAERLVADAARQSVRLQDGKELRFTVSIGYVCREPADGADNLQQMFERADAALYAAKHAGRNCAVSAAAVKQHTLSAKGSLETIEPAVL